MYSPETKQEILQRVATQDTQIESEPQLSLGDPGPKGLLLQPENAEEVTEHSELL